MAEAGRSSADAADAPRATANFGLRGAADCDSPVRRDFIDALQRRAALQHGTVRRVLDARLPALRASRPGCRAPGSDEPVHADDRTKPVARPDDAGAFASPLAHLVDRLVAHRGAPHGSAAAASVGAPSTVDAPTAAAQTLAYFRQAWSHLNAERRWAESLAALPENAGPLHSQHVVHRALTLMRAASPEYLERFVAHVEALMALERAGESASQGAVPASSPSRKRSRPIPSAHAS